MFGVDLGNEPLLRLHCQRASAKFQAGNRVGQGPDVAVTVGRDEHRRGLFRDLGIRRTVTDVPVVTGPVVAAEHRTHQRLTEQTVRRRPRHARHRAT